jgi:hypothetical protein
VEAVHRSIDFDGWGHFLEQGLGKTQVTLAEFWLLMSRGRVARALVICPNDAKEDWLLEARAELPDPEFPVYLWAGNEKEAIRFTRKNKNYIFVVNWEAPTSAKFKKVAEHLTGEDVYIVADESIKLKGHKIKTNAGFWRTLALQCGQRRVLSGKPITQGR